MNRLIKITGVLLSVSALGCTTVIGGKPRRCDEDWTWAQMDEYDNAFKPMIQQDGSFEPTKNLNLEDRLDYLDAFCKSVNAYRGD
jgi:hypothetical protein